MTENFCGKCSWMSFSFDLSIPRGSQGNMFYSRNVCLWILIRNKVDLTFFSWFTFIEGRTCYQKFQMSLINPLREYTNDFLPGLPKIGWLWENPIFLSDGGFCQWIWYLWDVGAHMDIWHSNVCLKIEKHYL